MLDLRPVLVGGGGVLVVMALAMLFPALLDGVLDQPDSLVFIASSGVTLYVGLLLLLGHWMPRRGRPLSLRQSVVLTCSGWLLAGGAGALPFAFSSLHLSVTDAVFESLSGMTATASTLLHPVAALPPGLKLWRGLLQWLGGGATLMLAIMVLPTLQVGGMQLFRVETIGGADRSLGRAFRLTGGCLLLYAGLTVLLALALHLAGMLRLNALIGAMAAVSCGGFLGQDADMAATLSPQIQALLGLGMLLGGGPFVVYWLLGRRRWHQIRQSSQVLWYGALLLLAGLSLAGWLMVHERMPAVTAVGQGLLTAISTMTGSGIAFLPTQEWGGWPAAILFFLSFVGGCAGSTSGGIKLFRLQVLLTTARLQLRRLLRPHAVVLPTYQKQDLSEGVAESVLGYLFVYTLSFAVVAMGLAMVGVEMRPALSLSAGALANLGPGPAVEPVYGLAELPDAGKWLLSLAMLFGRLELFLPLVLFVPGFWKK